MLYLLTTFSFCFYHYQIFTKKSSKKKNCFRCQNFFNVYIAISCLFLPSAKHVNLRLPQVSRRSVSIVMFFWVISIRRSCFFNPLGCCTTRIIHLIVFSFYLQAKYTSLRKNLSTPDPRQTASSDSNNNTAMSRSRNVSSNSKSSTSNSSAYAPSGMYTQGDTMKAFDLRRGEEVEVRSNSDMKDSDAVSDFKHSPMLSNNLKCKDLCNLF